LNLANEKEKKIEKEKEIEKLFDFHKLKNSLNVIFLGVQFLKDDSTLDSSHCYIIDMLHTKLKDIIIQIDNHKKNIDSSQSK